MRNKVYVDVEEKESPGTLSPADTSGDVTLGRKNICGLQIRYICSWGYNIGEWL